MLNTLVQCVTVYVEENTFTALINTIVSNL